MTINVKRGQRADPMLDFPLPMRYRLRGNFLCRKSRTELPVVIVGRVAVCHEQRCAHLIPGHPYLGVPPMRSFAQCRPRRRIRSVARPRWGRLHQPHRDGVDGRSERRTAGSFLEFRGRVRRSESPFSGSRPAGCFEPRPARRALRSPASMSAVRLLMSGIAIGPRSRASPRLRRFDALTRAREPMREAEHLDRERTNHRGSTGTVQSKPSSRRATTRARGVVQASTPTLQFHRFAENA